jgi:hypothetical protein
VTDPFRVRLRRQPTPKLSLPYPLKQTFQIQHYANLSRIQALERETEFNNSEIDDRTAKLVGQQRGPLHVFSKISPVCTEKLNSS